jgi:hypothetical protein
LAEVTPAVIFHFQANTMKKLQLWPLLIFGAALFGVSGCDLFEDEEHCQYDVTESKIWVSGQDPAFGVSDSSVTFVFNRSTIPEDRSYQIYNVCPLGAVVLNARLKEKGSIFGPKPLSYLIVLVEEVRTSERRYYVARKMSALYRQSETELSAQITYELLGVLDSGERKFFVGCAAIFEPGTFGSLAEMEAWAQENVAQVEFTSKFTRWQ